MQKAYLDGAGNISYIYIYIDIIHMILILCLQIYTHMIKAGGAAQRFIMSPTLKFV